MKRHKKKIIFILICVTLVFALPCFINLPFISSQIAKTAGEMMNSDISIQNTYWRWFPVPGISLRKTIIENSSIYAEADNIEISPSLLSLLTGNISISSLKISAPKINIKSLEALLKQNAEKKVMDKFPSLDVSVTDGELIVPFDGDFKGLKGRIQPFNITGINLEVNSITDQIQISTSLKAPYVSRLYTDITLNRSAGKNQAETFFCEIKANADNVDLSQIREALLLLLKDNETVQDVFGDTIIDGRATKAGFSYKGNVSEFDDLDKIVITADVDNAKIHIPETKIFLKDATGSFIIKDSVLTGENLFAKLKNSLGKKGKLSLGLAEDDFSFNLAIDIDADLSDLQETIDEFIEHPELKKQLAGIKNLKGRTPLTLKLMDNLNDLKTYVSLPALTGEFHYDFLNNEVKLQKGALNISPESVSWSNITCNIGPNSMSDISGSIALKNDLSLILTGEKIKLNSNNVYKVISSWPKVTMQTGNILKDIDGDVELSDFKLSGPLKKPAAVKYDFRLNSEAVTISSPMLPKPSIFSFKNAIVSDKKIIINQMKAKLKKSLFSVSTNLDHRLMNRLTGSIIVNGVAGKELTPWLRRKGWVDKSFIPKLPCNFSPLSILLKDGNTIITGNLIHGKKINTIVNFRIKESSEVSGSIELLSGKENAFIRIKYPERPNNRTIKISFDGDVSRNIITTVIDNDWLPGDNLKGTFDLLFPLDENKAMNMTGSAEIRNFNLKLDRNGAVRLDTIKITGKNDYADLSLGDLTFICPDNLKSIIKKNPIVSELDSRLYFQYDEMALLKIFSGNVCGASITGDLGLPSKKRDFKLTAGKKNQLTFDELFSCLGIKQVKITGELLLEANIKGTPTDISGSTIKLKASNGVVQKATVLAKILSLVDLTDLFRKNPVEKLIASGYHYDSIEMTAVISGNKLQIIRVAVYGSGVNLYGTGSIDLETMEIDMVVLASPLKTIDNIITSLPIIGGRMGGKSKSIISVPMKIEGKPENIKITFIPKRLTDVSSDIIDIFVKTFKLPFEVSYKLVKPHIKSGQ